VRLNWHVMSLAVLDEGTFVPTHHHQAMAASWRPIRVLSAAAAHGPDAVGTL
jgi:hypothetical protein